MAVTNPWGAQDSEWYSDSELRRWTMALPPSVDQEIVTSVRFASLANAAEFLGSQRAIMKSYFSFQTDLIHWFFSPNPHLAGAYKKPSSFTGWSDWDNFNVPVKKTIGNIAGFNANVTDLHRNDVDLQKLLDAYKIWNKHLYSVHWSNSQFGGSWMCNVFVGDALYLFTKKSITNAQNHYYGPEEIVRGNAPLRKVSSENAARGTIAIMLNGHHVEIITKIEDNLFSGDTFCSIGAGRGTETETGLVKCYDSDAFEDPRFVNNQDNTYFKVPG